MLLPIASDFHANFVVLEELSWFWRLGLWLQGLAMDLAVSAC